MKVSINQTITVDSILTANAEPKTITLNQTYLFDGEEWSIEQPTPEEPIEEPAPPEPIIVFEGVTEDDLQNWTFKDSNGLLTGVYDPTVSFPDGHIGAIVFGAPEKEWVTGSRIFSVTGGSSYQLRTLFDLIGSGSNTPDYYVHVLDSAGQRLWSSADIPTGFTTIDVNSGSPLPENAAFIKLIFTIRGIITGSRQCAVGYIQLADITLSGAAPSYSEIDPDFLYQTAYIGEPLSIDFGVSFTPAEGGNISGYEISPEIPHTWEGSTITIIPTQVMPQTVFNVKALNGSMKSAKASELVIEVLEAPATLSKSVEILPEFQVEVNRPIPYIIVEDFITGGISPFTYEQLSGPNWIETPTGGIVGFTPSIPTEETVTVRVTDRRGDFVDLTFNISVVAKYDRSNPRILQAGEIVDDVVRTLGAGDVLFIPASLGVVSFGNAYGMAKIPFGSQPIIIMGEAGTKVSKIALDDCTGLIIENLTVECQNQLTTDPYGSARSNAMVATQSCDNIAFYDITVVGYTEVLPQPLNAAWLNLEPFAYQGNGFGIRGTNYIVVHNCIADRVYEAFGGQAVFWECETRGYRDDASAFAQTRRTYIHGHKLVKAPEGNYTSADHRDLLQAFGNNLPVPKNLGISNCWFSCFGAPNVQGIHCDQDGWPGRNRDLSETYLNFIMRETVVLNSTDSHTFLFERFYDALVENCLLIAHPDNFNDFFGRCNMRRPSKITFRNSIIKGIGGDALGGTQGDWSHLLTFDNCIILEEGTEVTEIFPNFFNTTMTELERLTMDPVWSAAHPNVGPSILRA